VDERRKAAILAFALGAILGYAGLRLAASIGEPDPRAIGPTAHIPYYWRVATAGWWGGLAAVGGWRFPGVSRTLERMLVPVVALAVIAAFAVP
jgi:hypothetical protein